MSLEVSHNSSAPLTPDDLADLMAGFNEVSARLQATHETLREEVKRLNVELRDANEELQRSKRLAALGEMAAGISHEVRNPLGSIKLYARMLEQDLEELPNQQEIACKIGSAVTRLNEVVGDVLTFSKELRIRTQVLDPSELFERVLETCGSVLDAEPVVCIEAGLELTADSGLLEQALVNVVRNAAESMIQAGVSTGEMELIASMRTDALTGRPAAVLEVRDRGAGVEPDVIERMFNPFFTTRDTGTGLGLAIVHRILDAHRGRVLVLNNADMTRGAPGATVEMWIPQPLVARAINAGSRAVFREMERTV